MQGCGRRGDGPLLAREHRLIVRAVGIVGGASRGDVGRQRHSACALEEQLDRLVAVELEQEGAVLAALDSRRADAPGECDRVARLQPLRVADERPPAARPFAFVQSRADAGFTAAAFELRRDHLGVIEDQAIAGAEALRQVRDDAVGNVLPFDDHQPRGIPRPRGAQRDQLVRKVEVEEVDAHGGAIHHSAHPE